MRLLVRAQVEIKKAEPRDASGKMGDGPQGGWAPSGGPPMGMGGVSRQNLSHFETDEPSLWTRDEKMAREQRSSISD
jgi:hypothetical protein